jgi:arsenate reductase
VTDGLKRVLFVCIGNACRSQMAEAFAHAYGGDVMIAASAGLSPGMSIPSDTLRAMQEKNLDLRHQFPKSIEFLSRSHFDLVVNMSGARLPKTAGKRTVEWDVPDPVAMTYPRHCEVRDMIERKVMNLILELRQERKTAASRRS